MAQSDRVNEAIKSRLAPAGSVCMAGDECAGAPAAGAEAAGGQRDPADIYSSTCTTCHAAGVAGAPIVGNAEQWVPVPEQREIGDVQASALHAACRMRPIGQCSAGWDDELHR